MDICSHEHEEIVWNTRNSSLCPLCEAISERNAAELELRALERELERAKDVISEREEKKC